MCWWYHREGRRSATKKPVLCVSQIQHTRQLKASNFIKIFQYFGDIFAPNCLPATYCIR